MFRVVSHRVLRNSIPSALDSLPANAPSWYLLEKCIDYAAERGTAPEDAYSPWLLTDLMQNTFGILHEVLPCEFGWVGAIALSAIAVRGLVFPFTLQSIREGRLKSALLPQYSDMIREMSEMKMVNGNTKHVEKLQQLQKRYVAFTAKYGNVALKGTLASGIQIPLIMTGIVACNGLALHPALFPQIALEAPLWLTSASLPDPYYILPAINGGLVWFNMKYFGSIDASVSPKTQQQRGAATEGETAAADLSSERIKDLITSRMSRDSADRTSAQIDAMYKSKMMKYGKQMFPLLVVGITANFPAITLVYTISNILGAMGQNWLLTNHRFQTTFAIPAQTKRNTADVAHALERADELRKKITDISIARKSKRQISELEARNALRRNK